MPINLKIKGGNLISLAEQGHFDAIIHGCNCFHTMGAGIAKQLARKYPEVYEADIMYASKGDVSSLGGYSAVEIKRNSHSFLVVNAYVQYDYGSDGRKVEYSALMQVFNRLNNQLPSLCNHESLNVGIPMIGAGLAGGDWRLIESIINTTTPHLDITLVEYGEQ